MKNKAEKNNIATVAAITVISSCLMLGITGAYRLTAGEKRSLETVNEDTASSDRTSQKE